MKIEFNSQMREILLFLTTNMAAGSHVQISNTPLAYLPSSFPPVTVRWAIRHLHISHKAPYWPPKILHTHCFQFFLGRLQYPGAMKNKGYAKFWGAKKVHYGRCTSGVYPILQLQVETRMELTLF